MASCNLEAGEAKRSGSYQQIKSFKNLPLRVHCNICPVVIVHWYGSISALEYERSDRQLCNQRGFFPPADHKRGEVDPIDWTVLGLSVGALRPVGGSKKDTKKGNRGVGRDKAEVLKRSWVFSSLIS